MVKKNKTKPGQMEYKNLELFSSRKMNPEIGDDGIFISSFIVLPILHIKQTLFKKSSRGLSTLYIIFNF